ncbi:lysophospholipid acyltransferase family protein [Thermoanaerobacterium saccharolyticum]|uniref:Phospholipid/glycerol acyltransferase n=2 Tax=Thermoanaerobacterium TaxID=28895 RepID=W9E8N3_9THEO|nr:MULTISPECIES: lysophospholipid acyltransferase family protein [Thermoanaerobacterium]AFK86083.1 phospholipid/glycerol acyltransferase [Thermoanaerobacterium saccharolyticum JW/SL-YS485]ETO37175.1 phospholipid/glycerol acyltransferase [Thermoanaerobacterium aotearoense SCUT27]
MILYYFIKVITLAIISLFFGLNVDLLDDLPDGPCIFVANHKSILDPVVLMDSIDRRVFFIASKDLYKIPILNFILSALETIPIKKNSADVNALKKAIKMLDDGRSIALFPEGGISLDKSVIKIYKGAMYISCKTGCPIVPVGIRGTDGVLPMGEYFPHAGKISVTIGRSIYPDMSINKNDCLDKMAYEVLNSLNSLINNHDLK